MPSTAARRWGTLTALLAVSLLLPACAAEAEDDEVVGGGSAVSGASEASWSDDLHGDDDDKLQGVTELARLERRGEGAVWSEARVRASVRLTLLRRHDGEWFAWPTYQQEGSSVSMEAGLVKADGTFAGAGYDVQSGWRCAVKGTVLPDRRARIDKLDCSKSVQGATIFSKNKNAKELRVAP